jgi:hypothetical protein
MLNYSSFCISACLRGLLLDRPDMVIATSLQLLVGLSGWWIGRLKRCPIVFEVRDLWPESLLASGIGREDSLLIRCLEQVTSFLYRRCDRIVRGPTAASHFDARRNPDPYKRSSCASCEPPRWMSASAGMTSASSCPRERSNQCKFHFETVISVAQFPPPC